MKTLLQNEMSQVSGGDGLSISGCYKYAVCSYIKGTKDVTDASTGVVTKVPTVTLASGASSLCPKDPTSLGTKFTQLDTANDRMIQEYTFLVDVCV